MALALYRKYRPRTFAEVIGQEHVTEPLSQALRSGRLNHAYLFSGPRGCGKTSSARILARSLNCEHGPTPEPCGTCDSCRSLSGDGAGSIDVIEIDAASHGGVDDARELREKAFFAPANSRFKIYVIDEAHMVSSAGFNALLKLVEEPPEYVKFIFATTEPEKVLGTIKSRTHHYPFRLIPPKTLRPYLEQLTEAEGVQVEPAVFPLVVRAGGGSARDSLSVLDQLIAGAGPDGVSYARAAALLGVTDAALIDEMCDALAAGDGAAAYATVDRVAEAGHDPRRFASDLLERLRDLIVLQQVPDAATKGLIDGPDDQIERMAAQAQQLGPGTLSRCADIVHDGLVEMRGTTAPRLLLELICARMLLPGVDDSTGGLLQRLERMERRLTLAGTDAPSAAVGSAPATEPAAVRSAPPASPAAAAAHRAGTGTPAAAPTSAGAAPAGSAPSSGYDYDATADGTARTGGGAAGGSGGDAGQAEPVAPRRQVPPSAVMPDPTTPEPPRPGAAAPGELDAVAVRRVWPEVVGKVNRSNKRIAALMRDAVVRDLDGDTLVVTVKSSVLAKMMTDHARVLTDALYEELGGRWQIRCEVAGERGGMSPGNPRAAGSAPARPTPAAETPSRPAAEGPGRPAAEGSGRPAGAGTPVDSGSSDGTAHPGSAGRAPGGAAAAGPAGAAAAGRPGGVDAGTGGGANAGPGAADAGRTGGTAGGSPGGATGSARSGGAAYTGAPGSAHLGAAGRPQGRAGSGSPAVSGEDDDEGWPEPARPGGSTPPAESGGSSGSGGSDEGWPEAARPGGASASTVAPAAQAAVANGRSAPASGGHAVEAAAGRSGAAAPPRQAPVGNGDGGAGGAPVSSAIAAARAAAAGRGTRTAGAGTRTAAAGRRTADAEFAGEPPYDPDFDGPGRGGGRPGGGPPATAPVYEGFDPGDEPGDEVIDEKTARESGEAQAVRLLREAFGAEKIDEVPTR
ncbi:DNA polymerase III subunit gamma and tau [Micromonospora sp. NPDC002389]|uniref:DNA polymerase III subunit gamma and tau n=1 Tax=Micromonospora sp. NPDC002389 TaxID=3154272 RepID=UPI00332E776E